MSPPDAPDASEPPAGEILRREMLRSALVAGVLVGGKLLLDTAFAAEPKSPMPDFPVVDSHQHLWDLKKFRLPWLANQPKLAHDYTTSDYLVATAGIPIDKSVYLEVDVEPAQHQAEAEMIAELCRRGSKPCAAVIGGRPASESFRAYAAPFKDHPHIRGVRQVLHGPSTPRGYCLARPFVEGIRTLGELGLSFDVCIRPGELADAARLIAGCPDTFFILDHCGNADIRQKDQAAWKRDIAAVAQRKNVVVKISGVIANATPGHWSADNLAPIINHTLDVFGPDRVMFGGDWPVCTLGASYRQWFDALRSIVSNRPQSQQRSLFHDNAVRHYRLG